MRRVALLTFLALFLPLTAWADGIDLINQYGTATVTLSGVVSQGSELVQFGHIKAPKGHSLGSVSFTTGAFNGTNLFSNGTFSSAGSSLNIVGNGNLGQPKGVIFSGTFVGPISWTIVSHPNKVTYVFQLSGSIVGQDWQARTVSGTTTQTITLYQNQWKIDHKGGIHLGDTHLNIPEPGTLGLLGTGLLAMAGSIRRRFLS